MLEPSAIEGLAEIRNVVMLTNERLAQANAHLEQLKRHQLRTTAAAFAGAALAGALVGVVAVVLTLRSARPATIDAMSSPRAAAAVAGSSPSASTPTAASTPAPEPPPCPTLVDAPQPADATSAPSIHPSSTPPPKVTRESKPAPPSAASMSNPFGRPSSCRPEDWDPFEKKCHPR